MHYEGLNLLNEKLRIPCSLRHKNRKEKKIKTAEREDQLGRQRQKSGVDTPRRRRGMQAVILYIYTYLGIPTQLYNCSRNKT